MRLFVKDLVDERPGLGYDFPYSLHVEVSKKISGITVSCSDRLHFNAKRKEIASLIIRLRKTLRKIHDER